MLMIFFPWDQLTDAVANVAHVLYCSASNNLPLTEGAVMELILQLTQVLNSLIREFATTVSTVQQLHCLSVCVCVFLPHTLQLTNQCFIILCSLQGFMQVASEFQQIFSEPESPSLTQEHLSDPEFIQLWFKVKLLPLLPNVPPELLSCLSTKNFSCPAYQTM